MASVRYTKAVEPDEEQAYHGGAMNQSNYTIKGQWNRSDEGWTYEARAVTKTGRIISRATAHLAHDTDFALEEIHGPEGKAEIERVASQLCERLIPDSER